jgi:uncharacterized membrane protein YedE/YeeE
VRESIVAFASGALFAVGLALSGMTQPAKVIDFLNFLGDWDPSLALVMGGAIAIYMPFFRRVVSLRSPFLSRVFELPSLVMVDWRLLVGAGLFGVGWAVGGFCPGPALASAGTGAPQALVVVSAMVAGMLVWARIDQYLRLANDERS